MHSKFLPYPRSWEKVYEYLQCNNIINHCNKCIYPNWYEKVKLIGTIYAVSFRVLTKESFYGVPTII